MPHGVFGLRATNVERHNDKMTVQSHVVTGAAMQGHGYAHTDGNGHRNAVVRNGRYSDLVEHMCALDVVHLGVCSHGGEARQVQVAAHEQGAPCDAALFLPPEEEREDTVLVANPDRESEAPSATVRMS